MFSFPSGPHGGPPDHGFLLLTCSTGPMECLRYYTCRSSHPEDRKLPITGLKWDARTVTDIPGNNAHWFFAFTVYTALDWSK
jgi:hypothetical protein